MRRCNRFHPVPREVSAKRRAYGRFLPTPRDPSTLPTTHDGGIDDEAIGDDLVGEIAPFASGERCAGTFGPAPGTYLFVCNMIEKEDGEHVVWVVATACS